MQDRTRQGLVAALCVVIIAVTAGCNLKLASAGGRCAKVGDYAQDGTFTLKCSSGHRWQKGISVATADAALSVLLSKLRPATPVTVNNPITTLTGSADGSANGYDVGFGDQQVRPGVYYAVPNIAGCGWARVDSQGNSLGGAKDVVGPQFFLLKTTDARVVVAGHCTWTTAPTYSVGVRSDGDGQYRVGTEIGTGWFHANNSADCLWFAENSLDGSNSSVTRGNESSGPHVVQLSASDIGFESYGCGTWTALPAEPTRYLSFGSSVAEVVTGGQTATWLDSDTTLTATGDHTHLVLQGGGYTLSITAPTGSNLTPGTTYDGAQLTASPIAAGLSFGSARHTCSTVRGQVIVDALTFDGGGNVATVDVSFTQHCDAETDSQGVIGTFALG